MCPLKDFEHVPLHCLPVICQQFSSFPSSVISPLSLLFSFPLWDYVSAAVIVFYYFHWNLFLSSIKPNANPIPMPSCFCLTWLLFTLLPALASFQPYTLQLLCLAPLTPSSSHAYWSLALFLESQLNFCHDLALLNSTWPVLFSCWLCWTPRCIW